MSLKRMKKATKLNFRLSFLFATLATVAFLIYHQEKLSESKIKYENFSNLARSRYSGSCAENDTSERCSQLSIGLSNPLEKTKKNEQYRLFVHTEFYPPLASIGFYPWDYIVEPFKKTVMEVPESLLGENLTYEWQIRSVQNQTDPAVRIGSKISFVFTLPTVIHEVKLIVKNGDEVKSTYLNNMMCKYVRREIRTMTESDRRDYFYALGQLKGSSSVTPRGNSTLLPHQKTLQYMMIKHTHTGSCSPFHNGRSFFTSHAAFTMELEQSMRTVIPGVSQPYWDYTLDAKIYGHDWYLESPVFQHDWFGKASPDNEDRHVTTSWAKYIELPYMWNAPVHNSYGFVGNFINNNPSKYVTRTHSFCNMENRIPLPTCYEMKGCLAERNMDDLRQCMEGQLHKGLHMGIGGVWDCKADMQKFIEKWPEASLLMGQIAYKIVGITGAMMANRYLTCPEYCDLDVPFEECRCVCDSIDMDSPDFTWEDAYDLLEEAKVSQALKTFVVFPKDHDLDDEVEKSSKFYEKRPKFKGLRDEASQELWLFILEMACNPGKIGNMGIVSSSGDPIFWPLHPVFDRLWAYMRLNKNGEFDDFDWTWYDDDSECEGHRSYDALPFYSLFGDFNDPVHHYSNADLVDLLDPKDSVVPYVYDSFDWIACNE